MSGVHACTTYNEHVGTSTASAGRMPDGGAEQRQRRHGEDGRPTVRHRKLLDVGRRFWTSLAEKMERGSIPRF